MNAHKQAGLDDWTQGKIVQPKPDPRDQTIAELRESIEQVIECYTVWQVITS